MQLLKKTFVIVLFLSLITCFVLYRIDYFEKASTSNNSKQIVSNFFEPLPDSLNIKKHLDIDYKFVLSVDTINLTIKKRILKKFGLIKESNYTSRFASSKSAILVPSHPVDITENKEIQKKLEQLNIVTVGFSYDEYRGPNPLDEDLLDIINAIETKQLHINSNIKYYVDHQEIVEKNWEENLPLVVSFGFLNNEITYVSGFKVDDFINWYDEFDKKRKAPMFSSSKSLVVPNSDDISNKVKNQLKEDRALFKQKLTEYLNIKF